MFLYLLYEYYILTYGVCFEMTGSILHLNDSNFDNELKKSKFMIVDFWAEWCGPCQMFSSIFQDFANDNKEIICAKVNVDEATDTASKFGIMSIPAILIFKNGKLVKQQVGAIPKAMLQRIVDEVK